MDVFNNLQVANECLLDKKRTSYFRKAIREVVKRGQTVMDAGTGTGIMSLFAAEAGAKKVFAVDISEDIVNQAKRNVDASPYKHTIEVLMRDLKAFDKKTEVDVLIMEMLDTGLIAEQQAVALNHLRKQNIITDKTQLIPFKVECYLEAIEYDFNFYGFTMPFIIQARNYGANRNVTKSLAPNTLYAAIDFKEHIDTEIDKTVQVKITQTGTLNAIRLKTKTFLTSNLAVWGTSDMNMPVIVPLAETKVKSGDTVSITIKYSMGEGFAKFSANIVK